MATDKPRFTITLPDDVFLQVAQYKTENKISTQSKAIQKLIGIGLGSVQAPGQEAKAPSAVGLDAEDVDVARDYHDLDQPGKKVVRLVIGAEAERVGAAKAEAEKEAPPVLEEVPKTKIIPLFPAAAGPGDQQDGNAFESHEVSIMSSADFAVRVSGDSMEPELHHGDIVLCKKRKPMEGELAAIMVNGFLYVKQVEPDKYGNLHLLSINRARKNLDVHIPAESSDTVRLYGTLIHRMMPPINWRK